jgi:hypothetical protein
MKHLRFIVLAASFAALASCTSTNDPEYQALVTSAESNPPSEAVVGMWHRRKDQHEFSWRMNILMQRNGTGMVESYATVPGSLQPVHTGFDKLGAFHWKYQGQGVWQLRSQANPDRVDECRISGGKLLRYIKHWSDIGTPGYFVYDRVRM